MSFKAEIEHSFIPPEALPPTILGYFPNGAATVWSNETFTAAIPATNEQTNELADLFDIAAIALTPDDAALKAYYVKRDELCAPMGYQVLSALFIQEMEKLKAKEESPNAKYLTMASAARPQKHELN